VSRGPARTHSTVRDISRKTGIPKSSVVRIIRRDLQLKCFKRRRAQELTEANCTAGIYATSKEFFQFAILLIFFTDEKVFTMSAAVKELWKSVKISPSYS